MRRLAVIITLIAAASATAAEIKPADPGKPLFRVVRFLKVESGKSEPLGTVDNDHPLLTVWSVGYLVLAPDQKGVTITLTTKDARAFADITRKYSGDLILLDAGPGHALEVLHVAAPVIDGKLSFNYPGDATIAEYLRRRFRLAEFR